MEKGKVRGGNKNPNDSQILELYRKRLRKAVEETKKAYGDYCYSLAFRILGDEYDAEECVSNVYEKAWEELSRQQSPDMKKYLRAATRRMAIWHYDGQNAEKRYGETGQILEEFFRCAPTAKESDDGEFLNLFLNSIDRDTRVIFLRRYWYLCPLKEIAELMRLKVSDVKDALRRSRKQFAKCAAEAGCSAADPKAWLELMSYAKDCYVEEAAPEKTGMGWRIKWRKIRGKAAATAAALAGALAIAAVVLFLPYNSSEEPDISQYSGREYYPVIQKLNQTFCEEPDYRNRFEKIAARWNAWREPKQKPQEEVTENPAEPVTYVNLQPETKDREAEADFLKRRDHTFYYLGGNALTIYEIEGELKQRKGEFHFAYNMIPHGMHISADGNTAIVFMKMKGTNETQVRMYSISNPKAIREKARYYVSGEYRYSRMENGNLLLITHFTPGKQMNFDNAASYLPQIEMRSGRKFLPMEKIILPEHAREPVYTMVTALDAETLEWKDSVALLSADDSYRIFDGHIYLTNSYERKVKEKAFFSEWEKGTELFCLEFDGEQFQRKGRVAVPGTLPDRYALDEYDGFLHICTVTDRQERRKIAVDSGPKRVRTEITDHLDSALFCVDVSDWNVKSQSENLTGEEDPVASVRFDREKAYVSTVSQQEVWRFDFSDPSRIVRDDIKNRDYPVEVTHPLAEFGENYLLGLEYMTVQKMEKLQLTVYERTKDGIRVCSSKGNVQPNIQISESTCWIDSNLHYIGVGYVKTDSVKVSCVHSIYDFSVGTGILPVTEISSIGYNIDEQRGIIVDNFLYMFGENGVRIRQEGIWFEDD